jgi:uncharacterized protein
MYKLNRNYYEIEEFNNKVIYLNKYSGNWFITNTKSKYLVEALKKGVSIKEFERLSLQEQDTIISLNEGGVFDQSHIEINRKHLFQINLIVIEPLCYCNLACSYCFEDTKGIGEAMSFSNAEKIVKKIEKLNLSNNLTIEFNGGEVFQRLDIIKFIIKKALSSKVIRNRNLSFSIQSNGTIMSNDIINLIEKYNIYLGISIDGNKEDHDRHRVFINGNGSHKSVMRNIKKIRKNNINFSVIAVVESPNQIVRSFDFFSKTGIKLVMFNVRRYSERMKNIVADLTEIADKHFDVFLESLANFKVGIFSPILVEFQVFIKNMIQPENPPYMCLRKPCGAGTNMLVFDAYADTYVCQDLIREPTFKVCSTDSDIVTSIEQSKIIKLLKNRSSKTNDSCYRCNWQKFCHGGCYSGAYFESGKNINKSMTTRNPHCNYYSEIFRKLIRLFATDSKSLIEYAYFSTRNE